MLEMARVIARSKYVTAWVNKLYNSTMSLPVHNNPVRS